MEGNLEGTNPISNEHAELRQDKGAKSQHDKLVDRIIATHPRLSTHDARTKLSELEKKHGYYFSGRRYPDAPNRRLVYERKRLSVLEELNFLTEEEKSTLERLRENFRQTAQDIAKTTREDLAEIQNGLDTALISDAANNLSEAKQILIEGPIIEGFEDTKDPSISNQKVLQFLKDTFTLEALRKAKVGRIIKNDDYLIFTNESQHLEKRNQLFRKGIIQPEDNRIIAKGKESYLQAEMLLEGIDDPTKLKHTYKVRADSGLNPRLRIIRLGSFGVESPDDFDYLADIELSSSEDKMRAFILGTIVHEVSHCYEAAQLDKSTSDQYKRIIEEESSPQRPKYVSDYVVKHKEMYGSNEHKIFREDLAESIRIFTTNPEYLARNYPKRLDFIRANFPFIKEGSVISTLKANS